MRVTLHLRDSSGKGSGQSIHSPLTPFRGAALRTWVPGTQTWPDSHQVKTQRNKQLVRTPGLPNTGTGWSTGTYTGNTPETADLTRFPPTCSSPSEKTTTGATWSSGLVSVFLLPIWHTTVFLKWIQVSPGWLVKLAGSGLLSPGGLGVLTSPN